MPVNIPRLRRTFAVLAIAIVVLVAGFYFYGRLRVARAIKSVPQKIGVDVQQSTAGFSLCRSDQGRTLFCVNASKAIQYKAGGHASLQNVSIVVYGPESNRFDQIYGSDFDYDPKTGEVSARGEVHIDLEAYGQGPVRPDQAPPAELKNPVHLKTSGLAFNQKTGIAETKNAIEFRIPQASGSALGAVYDARSNVLKLLADVRVTTGVRQPATIVAENATITKEPRQAELQHVRIEQGARSVDAARVAISLRDDNHIDRVLASGDVRATDKGPTTTVMSAPTAQFTFSGKDALREAVLSGGVTMESSGASVMHAKAGKLVMDFGERNRLETIHAADAVDVVQPPKPQEPSSQGTELTADAVDFKIRNGRALESATTAGAAQITMTGANPSAGSTVITAGKFNALFDARGRVKALRGAPDAKIVSTTPGQPQRVSTSREMTVGFAPKGGIASITQDGDVRFTDAERTAFGQEAHYNPGTDQLIFTGSPRVEEAGFSMGAQSIRINRRTGDASADGQVKATYVETRPQTGGALLAAGEPIHITSDTMTAHRTPSSARFSGHARLWQGANIIEAAAIDFDRDRRTLVAQSGAGQQVSMAFVQLGKNGQATPVNVTSARLTYSDTQRQAIFGGGVTVKGADSTMTADQVDVYVLARGEKPLPGAPPGAGQVERIVASGHIRLQELSRRASGERLVYTASDGKFVLTGGPPSIFDAEHGSVTGDSLTFFSRDDRVLIESSGTSRTVTQTRVKQ